MRVRCPRLQKLRTSRDRICACSPYRRTRPRAVGSGPHRCRPGRLSTGFSSAGAWSRPELPPAMAARGKGAIINVGTVAAEFGIPGMSLYGATKASLEPQPKLTSVSRHFERSLPTLAASRQPRRGWWSAQGYDSPTFSSTTSSPTWPSDINPSGPGQRLQVAQMVSGSSSATEPPPGTNGWRPSRHSASNSSPVRRRARVANSRLQQTTAAYTRA